MTRYEEKHGPWHGGILSRKHYESGMPQGFWDVEKQRFFVADSWSSWTHDDYDLFMRGAISRRTLAPAFARKEVLTSNGRIVEEGMVCLLVGGCVVNRPHWNLSKNIGMRVVVMNRYAQWHFGEKGKQVSYGDCGITLREYGCCKHPSAYWICPEEDGRDFIIEGRNFDAAYAALPIEDPSTSLLAIDDCGSRVIKNFLSTPEMEKRFESTQ